jgi:membrane associated rhomboid family serine protease
MFPIADDNPTLRTPVMTIAILVVTWAVWLLVQGAGNPVALAISVCNLGLVPGELTHLARIGDGVPLGVINGQQLACNVDNDPINWLTPLISIFLHGSWSHIIGNSLYLWVFGNNIEDSMGRARFLAFYLITGVIAAAAHVAISPTSPVPTVGASGAISGIMGAYLVLYPRVSVRTFFPPIFLFRVPAWSILILWFGSQVLSGLPQLRPFERDVGGGVAVWAHIGGFIAGVVLVRVFRNNEFLRRRRLGADAKVVWS